MDFAGNSWANERWDLPEKLIITKIEHLHLNTPSQYYITIPDGCYGVDDYTPKLGVLYKNMITAPSPLIAL